ncbi:hypothetical protein Misp01_70620 [Microtetraspora sp. NBRC 13810]|nr:hypothetical protein Misp01_70620 [Microtetraspora sp. NBRC 13810]
MIDGRPALRIERRLAHPPEKVWRALTEPGQLSQWYPFRALRMDLRPGGMIHFEGDGGTVMDAVITELDPPRVFAFSEHAPEEMPRESDDLVHFELRPDPPDGCLLIFTHVFDDRPAAASYASGWHSCLAALALLLDERPVEWPTSSFDLYETYVAEFGLNAGITEETPEGWRVRFERQLMHQPVDKVWAVLTEGGSAEAGGPPPRPFTTSGVQAGPVTDVEAQARLEYGWRQDDRPAGRVRWKLSTGPGGARITLTQTGPDDLPAERVTALTAWQTHLDHLVKELREMS